MPCSASCLSSRHCFRQVLAATLLSFKTPGRHVSSCCVSGRSPAGPSTCSSAPRRRPSPSRTASLLMRRAPPPASAPDHGRGPCPLSCGRSPWQQGVPPGGRQRPRWQTALTTFLHSPCCCCCCCCCCSAGDMQLVLPAVRFGSSSLVDAVQPSITALSCL